MPRKAYVFILTVLISVLSASLFTPSTGYAAVLPQVSGVLVDAEGNPASNVLVAGEDGVDTDAQGRFALQFRPGSQQIAFITSRDPDVSRLQIATNSFNVTGDLDLGTVRLPRLKPVTLIVNNEDGFPVKGASLDYVINLKDGYTSPQQPWLDRDTALSDDLEISAAYLYPGPAPTDKNGRKSLIAPAMKDGKLPRGAVTYTDANGVRFSSELSDAKPGPNNTYTLTLNNRLPQVSGVLVDAEGNPASNVLVAGEDGVDTDAQGRFALQFRPGSQQIAFITSRDPDVSRLQIATNSFNVTGDLDLGTVRLPRLKPVTLIVNNEDGFPVKGASLDYVINLKDGYTSPQQPWLDRDTALSDDLEISAAYLYPGPAPTDKNGRKSLIAPAMKDGKLPRGAVTYTDANGVRFSSELSDAKPGPNNTYTLTLNNRLPQVSGVLVDAEGNPASNVLVAGEDGVDTDAQGRFALQFRPGSQQIAFITSRDPDVSRLQIATNSFNVTGDLDLGTVRLPRLKPVTLIVNNEDGFPVKGASLDYVINLKDGYTSPQQPWLDRDTALSDDLEISAAYLYPGPAPTDKNGRKSLIAPAMKDGKLPRGAVTYTDANGVRFSSELSDAKPGPNNTYTLTLAGYRLPSIANVAVPTITGPTTVGSTLQANDGTWNPADVQTTRQWLRDGQPISNAVGTSYVLTADDQGTKISVRTTATKTDYNPATATSDQTAAIKLPTIANDAAPTITGPTTVGSTLQANDGTWNPSTVQTTRQWLRDGQPISNAVGTSYVLTADDQGTKISVRTTATKTDYNPATATSDQTAAIKLPTIANDAAPTITGPTTVGSTLQANDGTWNPSTVQTTRQWLRDGQPISNAVGTSYVLTADDQGTKISVRTTATKTDYNPATATSDRTAAIKLPTIANDAAPTITGPTTVGSTLQANDGTWNPSTVQTTRQWLRDGQPISNAVGTSYVLTADDQGTKISVRTTATKTDYNPATATSDQTAAIKLPTIANDAAPTITGPTTVGSTLQANDGTWNPSTVQTTRQWLRDGQPISNAVGTSYVLTADDQGTKISVRTTATKTDYNPATATSDQTAIPAAQPDAPVGVSVRAANGSATVSWIKPASNGSPITGFVVRSSPGTFSKTVGDDATSATLSGLVNGTDYSFTVQAVNSVGVSPPSEAISGTPSGAPAPPTGLKTSSGDKSATVSWTPGSSNGSPVTKFTITRNDGATMVVDAAKTSSKFGGLTNGKTYTFTITATNQIGTSDRSAVSPPVVPAGMPGTVAKPSAKSGKRFATITWKAPSANGASIAKFEVTSSSGATKTVSGTARQLKFTGLKKGKKVWFKVRAMNAAGYGRYSSRSQTVKIK